MTTDPKEETTKTTNVEEEPKWMQKIDPYIEPHVVILTALILSLVLPLLLTKVTLLPFSKLCRRYW